MRPIFLLVLLVVGCAPTPEGTFGKMKKAACGGDVAGFFENVDKTALADNVAKRSVEDAVKKDPKNKLGRQMAELAAPRAAREAIDAWEDDIKKGEGGDLCKLTFESVGEVQNLDHPTATVHSTTGTGRKKAWVFSQFGKKWMLTDLL